MGRHTKDNMPIETYEKGKKVSWTAIQYLVAAAAYGGRITDELDRRLINVYAKEIFDDDLISATERWIPKGTQGVNNYRYPADEMSVKTTADQANIFIPEFFLEAIQTQLEDFDPPQAFGQHTNAQISSQILESLELLDDILSLQPVKSAAGGMTQEERTLIESDRIKEKVPQEIDVAALKFRFRNDENPLNVVLIQEIQRYNALL